MGGEWGLPSQPVVSLCCQRAGLDQEPETFQDAPVLLHRLCGSGPVCNSASKSESWFPYNKKTAFSPCSCPWAASLMVEGSSRWVCVELFLLDEAGSWKDTFTCGSSLTPFLGIDSSLELKWSCLDVSSSSPSSFHNDFTSTHGACTNSCFKSSSEEKNASITKCLLVFSLCFVSDCSLLIK